MKFGKILAGVTQSLSGLKLGGKKSDPKLAELDRGVLEVALMVSALDGEILFEEYSAFVELAKKCRGYSAKNARQVLDRTLERAGYLMAMAQVGVYSEKERLDAFVKMATAALPGGFLYGSMADLRRAFALWVTMGVADGSFSDIERKAVGQLAALFAKMKLEAAKERLELYKALSPTFRQAYGYDTRVSETPLLEENFLAKAEKIVRQLAVPARRAKAEEELAALIGSVEVTARDGSKTVKDAASVAIS